MRRAAQVTRRHLHFEGISVRSEDETESETERSTARGARASELLIAMREAESRDAIAYPFCNEAG